MPVVNEFPRLFYITKEKPLRGPDFTERAQRLGETWAIARADMADASFWVRAGEAFRRKHYGDKWLQALKRAMNAEGQMTELGVEFVQPWGWTEDELRGQIE